MDERRRHRHRCSSPATFKDNPGRSSRSRPASGAPTSAIGILVPYSWLDAARLRRPKLFAHWHLLTDNPGRSSRSRPASGAPTSAIGILVPYSWLDAARLRRPKLFAHWHLLTSPTRRTV